MESRYHLGKAARIVNKAVRFISLALLVPGLPAGCLLGFLHYAFIIVTFGIYALMWTILWLPFLGMALGTSWLWGKASILWPVWVLIEIPFLVLGYVVVLLGPQDVGGGDKAAKIGILDAWPYSYFVMFDKKPIGDSWEEGDDEPSENPPPTEISWL